MEVFSGALTGGTSLIGSARGKRAADASSMAGRIRQQVELQSAVQEQAVASYDATVLLALEEVENALVPFEKNRLRLDVAVRRRRKLRTTRRRSRRRSIRQD